MVTLAELRASRYEGVDEDRMGTDQRAAREWSSGRVTIPDEYQVHYRDDYGTTLTDQQYEDANKDQATFKASVDEAKSKLSSKKTEVQGLYDKQISEWNQLTSSPIRPYSDYLADEIKKAEEEELSRRLFSKSGMINNSTVRNRFLLKNATSAAREAYMSALSKDADYMKFYEDWSSKNTIKVSVVDPTDPSINKDYLVTPDTAKAVDAIDFQGYGDATKRKDGSIVVYSDTFAKDMREELDKYEIKLHTALSKAYEAGVAESITAGTENLNRELSLANESIASQERIVAAKEAENANTLSTIRTTYSNKLKAMGETIGSMNYAKSN